MFRPGLAAAALLLAAGCHHGRATADAAAIDALGDGAAIDTLGDGSGPGSDDVKPATDGPGADRPAVTSPADAGTDAAPVFGCPGGCPAGQVCAIFDFRGIDPRGSCVAPPPQCRPEAGPPDAGIICDQCTGFALCKGAYACMGTTTAVYRCGI